MSPKGPGGPPRPRTQIDPRISARRTEVTRQQGRRRLRWAGTGVAVVLVLFGAWSLLHSSMFSARAVTVVGATHETAAQVESAAGLNSHPPLLDVDPGAMAAGIERLPWVRSATVSTDWPDGVRVAVTERVPHLVMSTAAGQWAELSTDGRVLAVVPTRPPGLLEVTGPKPPAGPGTRLGPADQLGLRIAASLPLSFRAQVTEVKVVSAGFVQLEMTTPIVFDLGDASQLHAKYVDVSAALANATLHVGDVIDVSVPRAMTVTEQ
jgi:cell division protein FtsQ